MDDRVEAQSLRLHLYALPHDIILILHVHEHNVLWGLIGDTEVVRYDLLVLLLLLP